MTVSVGALAIFGFLAALVLRYLVIQNQVERKKAEKKAEEFDKADKAADLWCLPNARVQQEAPLSEPVNKPQSRRDWESTLARLVPNTPEHRWYVYPSIPHEKLHGAIREYASGLMKHEYDVLALLDATLRGTGRSGCLLTVDGIWYKGHSLVFGRRGSGMVQWSEIAETSVIGPREIEFTLLDGSKHSFDCGLGALARNRLQELSILAKGEAARESPKP